RRREGDAGGPDQRVRRGRRRAPRARRLRRRLRGGRVSPVRVCSARLGSRMERVESGLRWAASVTMLAALFLIFCVVPTESEMGIVQRIFYFHVPCAFTAYAGFLTVAVSSVV